MAARLAPLITAVMGGQPGRATLRELDALAARAETLTGSRAGQLAAADVWDWIGRARELSPDPLEATADRALDRSASWWESAGMPERARHARDCIARGQLFRSGVLAPELLRLVTVLRDPAAPANLRVEALLELGQLQLRSGDPAEGVRALRQAGAALSVDPTADWPLQAEQHLLAYRIDRELAVVTGAADRLRTAHHHRQAADRLIAAATGRRADPGPLDLLVDYLDDWDIAARQDPADPRLQSRAEDLLARWSADPLPHAADVAAAIARRLADLHLRTGDTATAASLLRSAASRVPARRRHDLGAALLVRLARAEADLNRWPAAEQVTAEAITLIEPLRASVTGVRPREGYTGERIDAYLVSAEAALRRGDIERLLQVTELVKGRRLARTRVAAQDRSRSAVAAAVRALRAEGHEPRLGEEQLPEALWLRRLAADAWEAAGPYATLPPFELASLRRRLAADEAVLSYFWLDPGRLAAVAIRSDAVWSDVLPVGAATRGSLERVTALVTSGTMRRDERFELGDIGPLGAALLPPARVLDGIRRLYVSPHRLLHALPLGTLELDGVPLIDVMTVVIAPSLTALARPRPGPATGDLVAVDIADFSAYPNVPSLDLIATSAKAAYRRWHRHGRLRAALSDADATVDAVLDRADDLAKAGFIQLVTHGTNPRPEAAVEPRLALYDGALDDLDLALWSLDGPLVLLLACHSGQRAVRGETGAELVADEVNGLAAALFSAGAGAVLGALWHAEEPFAAALIAPLHDRLLAGEPADHALREALRNTRDSRPLFRRPYFWAPYTLTTATLLPTKDQP